MEPGTQTPKNHFSKIVAKIRADTRLLIAVIMIPLLILCGLIYLVINSSDSPQETTNTQTAPENTISKDGPPTWAYNQETSEWFVQNGTAPACKDPFTLDMTPVDMAKVTAVGLPGAYRGFSYKAHGGFRLVDSTGGNAEIKMPTDAKLMGITRYYEAIPGKPHELQYLLHFENDCGIAFRFDHIATLTPAMQALAEKTPEPKKDDTRGPESPSFDPVPLKAGEVIATAVGFPLAKNYGFDFGVYDYRARNAISENEQWAAIHQPFSASEFHGVCWIPLLPGDDAAKAEAMAKDRNNYNSSKPFYLISDYCDFAPYKTLDFNNGQPTEG